MALSFDFGLLISETLSFLTGDFGALSWVVFKNPSVITSTRFPDDRFLPLIPDTDPFLLIFWQRDEQTIHSNCTENRIPVKFRVHTEVDLKYTSGP